MILGDWLVAARGRCDTSDAARYAALKQRTLLSLESYNLHGSVLAGTSPG